MDGVFTTSQGYSIFVAAGKTIIEKSLNELETPLINGKFWHLGVYYFLIEKCF